MGKGRGRCRVGHVVGWDIDGLDAGNRAFTGTGNPFLELTHFLGQVRLITHSRRQAAEQGRDFGPGLGVTEDVVNK